MELRQLRYFVTVAEELHFGRAAERLVIGQPAVSQQIRRLERELKIELFDRTPRIVRLTAAGQAFLPAARAVLAAEDSARAVAAELTGGGRGVFRLGTITGLGERLDRVLEAFGEHAPGVRVELVALPVRERLARLADGRLDAVFVRGGAPASDGAPAQDGAGAVVQGGDELRRRLLWEDELVAAVPARHPLAEQSAVSLAELAALPLRLTERRHHPALVDLVLDGCRKAGFEPTPGPVFSSLQDTLAAIGSGTPMWTVVYAGNARLMRLPRVAFVPFSGPGLRLPVELVVRGGTSSPLVGLLQDAVTGA
ncbi:LysR family transcriptional regulator [Streptomyces rectiverticillatus]|uniref:LysR substrate-binding domain-containing protein n=1 Tax=Streptomyces rectiverticillatus TaxID=173860 RepID=UPI0015C38473|nr:LysR family transcriptional regulator [Streptomyces rectiverticillatus]QLE70483.1 LysR family transcriptional regulator [Streptomyces rectiverticillatus]